MWVSFSKWKPWKRLVTIASVTIFLGMVVYFVVVDFALSNAVSRATIFDLKLQEKSSPAISEEQVEGHTCGLHALRSLYQAYGLNPDAQNLRYRIGVDRGAIPVMASTQGTLQPDITRVLAQDGFAVSSLVLDSSDSVANLQSHLGESQLVLSLIRRLANGNLHWVLLQNNEQGEPEVIDSLATESRPVVLKGFLDRQAITLLLVSPRSKDESPKVAIKGAHRLGVDTLKKTPKRVKLLEKRYPLPAG